MRFFLLFIILGISTITYAQSHTISGYLSDFENGEKLIGASIYESFSKSGTTSNVYGFYSITLPADSVQLRISYVGYQTQTIKLYHNKDTTINLSFKNNNELDEVLISAKVQEKIQDDSQMSEISIPMQKVKSLPMLMGERDVLKTIQLLPGVQSGSEGGSGMYVRGGGPDQNLILLDGVPIYNASHLFGFFSVFNGDAINSVKLIKGGFPARYGGRLSSVIDLRMKEGNNKKIKGEGGIGLISSRFTLDGPIIADKTSFLISARRTYIDVLAQPFIRAANNSSDDSNTQGGYYFYDLNGKVNHKFSERSRLYASGYFGKDRFYSTNTSNYTFNADEYSFEDESSLKWGNAIAALRWNYVITPKLFSNVTASFSNYKFSIGFGARSEERVGGETLTSEESFEYFSGIRDYAFKVDFDFAPTPNHLIKFGTGITTHLFKPGINSYFSSYENNNETDTAFGNSNIDALEFAIYVEDDFKINNRIKVNFGVHAS
ncbi:MAG: outer membrane receptor for ferrienterochelin and colicin, partial [Gammaproteobacteria bacterium]